MAETIVDQIISLRDLIVLAKTGDFTAPGLPVMAATLPVDQKLLAFNIALLRNLAETVSHHHDQIAMAFNFARHMVFHAHGVVPDLRLWTNERNDDVELAAFLFLRAQTGVEALVTAMPDEDALPYARRQKTLLDEFNVRNQRMANGQTLYDAEERPALDAGAEELLTRLRARQADLAVASIGSLTNRALLSLGRARLIDGEIAPLFRHEASPDADGWVAAMAEAVIEADGCLEQAETLLVYHAARHTAFPRRLAEAKSICAGSSPTISHAT